MGHAGTLDPFATGLLIAASGKLTKAAGMLSDMDKEYESVFRFGAETDTLDTEGDVIAQAPVPDISDIKEALISFSGEISQVPPAFSAVKINGKRAYARARNGEDVEMPERRVVIHSFEILSWNSPDLEVRIRCSKGTYIRSIARDLALASGSRGYCVVLKRTAIGPFGIEDATGQDEITPESGLEAPDFFTLLGIRIVTVKNAIAANLRSGVPLHRIDGFELSEETQTLYVDEAGKSAALLEWNEGKPMYRIVFD